MKDKYGKPIIRREVPPKVDEKVLKEMKQLINDMVNAPIVDLTEDNHKD